MLKYIVFAMAMCGCASRSYTTNHGLRVLGSGLQRKHIEAITEFVLNEFGGSEEIKGVIIFLQTKPLRSIERGNSYITNGYSDSDGRFVAINVMFPHCAELLADHLVNIIGIKIKGVMSIENSNMPYIKDKLKAIICGK